MPAGPKCSMRKIRARNILSNGRLLGALKLFPKLSDRQPLLSIITIQSGKNQAWVQRRVDNAIHSINHYPTDSVMRFVRTCSLDNPIYYVRRLHCSASNPMDREVSYTGYSFQLFLREHCCQINGLARR